MVWMAEKETEQNCFLCDCNNNIIESRIGRGKESWQESSLQKRSYRRHIIAAWGSSDAVFLHVLLVPSMKRTTTNENRRKMNVFQIPYVAQGCFFKLR